MNSLVLLSTLTLLFHARPSLCLPGYKNQILLKLKDGPLSAGDQVVLDGKFRNRMAFLRFISISKSCPGPTPAARHVLPQCHPLIMKFKPRYHQIQLLYKGHPNMNREVEVDVINNINVTIGRTYQLLIKVGRRNFTIYLNGVHIKTMYDEIGHDNIIHVRSYGGYFKKFYVVRAPSYLKRRYGYHANTCGVRPGLSTSHTRITGGINARTGEFPWQAAIRRKVPQPDAPFKHLCGASLISSCWVITAAHCLAEVAVFPKGFVVRVGDYFNGDENFFSSREAVEEFDIERVIPHELFRARPSPLHDIALIKLKANGSKCAKFNDIVWPICLPARNETKPVGSLCTVTGWGAKKWEDRIMEHVEENGSVALTFLEYPGLFPKVLQKADIKIKDHLTCQKSYGYNPTRLGGGFKVPKESVCAADTGRDACQGDSGGPLACRRTTQIMGYTRTTFVLWGVTSWGDTCAKPDKPGIFTKVVDYLDWIEHNTRD